MSDARLNTFKELAAGYVDGELTPDEKREFETMLAKNPELQNDVEAFRKVNTLLGKARFEELPDPLWEAYQTSLYRKSERAFGWIFFSVGAIVVLAYAAWEFLNGFLLNPDVPALLRVAIGAAVLGAVVMLVSYLREAIFAHKRDRYGKVQK